MTSIIYLPGDMYMSIYIGRWTTKSLRADFVEMIAFLKDTELEADTKRTAVKLRKT